MSRYVVRSPGDPLAWVFGIVLGALVLIGIVSLTVRASVDADSRRVSLEGVALVGDATAVQVAASTRPADAALRAMTTLLGGSADVFGDSSRLVDGLASAIEAQPAIAAVAVATADGAIHELMRSDPGYRYSEVTPTGSLSTRNLDQSLTPVEPTGADASPARRPLDPWVGVDRAADGVQWGDPVPVPNGRTTVTASMVVTVPGEQPSMVVAVRLDSDALTRTLAQSPAATYGEAALAGADGTPLAGESGLALPSGVEAVAVANGVVALEDSMVTYERAVSDDIPWLLTVQIDGDAVLPAVGAVDRTMTLFSAVIIAITAALALVLWILRRPAGEVSLRARTDALTGLSNRHHFEGAGSELLSFARRKDVRALVVVFDLDHFKSINDGAGHEAGDAALAAVADGLTACAGARDVVARLGGDEFGAVLLIADHAEPAQVVERMRASAARALDAAVGAEFEVGVSAGWVEATGADRRLHPWVAAADDALVAGRTVAKGVTYASPRT